jgi:hypothetical protein
MPLVQQRSPERQKRDRERSESSECDSAGFPDEARAGLKNTVARRWAKRATRASAPHDRRTASSDLPGPGKGAGHVLPVCNTGAMSLHPAEIARTATPGAHEPRARHTG